MGKYGSRVDFNVSWSAFVSLEILGTSLVRGLWFVCQSKLTFGRCFAHLHQASAYGGQAREDGAILRFGF